MDLCMSEWITVPEQALWTASVLDHEFEAPYALTAIAVFRECGGGLME